MKLLTIYLFCLFSLWSFSKSNYVIKAPQTSLIEFRSYLESESSLPYVQEQREWILKDLETEKQEILSLLEQAQESFLKGHLKDASQYFNEITKRAYNKDWDLEVQKIIFYSFLRLAQIEKKGGFSDSFIHSALIFAPHLEPDAQIFQPPFIEKLNQIKSQLPLARFRLGKIFLNHEKVFINGKEFATNEQVRLPYGKYRITALSSSHKPWTQVILISEFIRKNIVTASWVRGGCQSPDVSKSIQNYEVLFPNSCVWKNSPVSEELTTKVLQVEKAAVEKSSFDFKKHSHWFWIAGGIGGVALTVFIVNSYSSDASEPSVTIGF